MELIIGSRHHELTPGLERDIARRAKKLEKLARLVACEVTIAGSQRHQRGFVEARLHLSLRGTDHVVTKSAVDARKAIVAAFAAAERLLAERRLRRKRAPEKSPGSLVRGAVDKIFPDRGYGFIRTEAGTDVYFHRNTVHDIPFDGLTVGMEVECEIEEGKEGPQASRVVIR